MLQNRNSHLLESAKFFLRSERGVVGLVFAIVLPFVLTAMYLSFQFDQYNRSLTRTGQAQFAALRGAYKENASIRVELTKKLVEMNTPTFKETIVLNDSREEDGYLWSNTIIKDNNPLPLVSFAKDAQFDSTMRIRIAAEPGLDACRSAMIDLYNKKTDASYKLVLENCGHLKKSQIRQIDNKYRIFADQQALINIGKFFFRDGTGMSLEDAWKFGAWNLHNSYKTLDNFRSWVTRSEFAAHQWPSPDNNRKLPIAINYQDVATADESNRTFLRYDTNSMSAFHWMQEDFGTLEDGVLTYTSESYFTDKNKNEAQDDYFLSNMSSIDINDDAYTAKIQDTLFFYSDWMLEDMSGWAKGDKNFRTVRVLFDLDSSDHITAVRVRMNRGDSLAWGGTISYDLDVTVTESGSAQTVVLADSTVRTTEETADTPNKFQEGVYRNEQGNGYKNFKKAFDKAYPGASEIKEYQVWYYSELTKNLASNLSYDEKKAIVERITGADVDYELKKLP